MIEKDAKRYKEFCNHVEGYGAFSPWLDEYDPFTETGLAFVHGGSEDNGQFGLGDIDLGFGKVDFTYQDVLEKVKAYRDECKGQMDPDFPEECEYVDELDELVRALTDWCSENESKKSESGDALKKVVDAASAALNNYDSDNVDVIEDEETGELVVMFHSSKTSHPITNTGVYADDVDLRKLEKELDKLTVGYMFESKKSEARDCMLCATFGKGNNVYYAADDTGDSWTDDHEEAYVFSTRADAKKAVKSFVDTLNSGVGDHFNWTASKVSIAPWIGTSESKKSEALTKDTVIVGTLDNTNKKWIERTLQQIKKKFPNVESDAFGCTITVRGKLADVAKVLNAYPKGIPSWCADKGGDFLPNAAGDNLDDNEVNKVLSESKKSEAFGDSIKMNIDYETFKRLCSTAAYLDSDEDYWDALWDYYSEMGEVSGSALEFFDNLFQYTDWADEERVYDEILDDKYKDDNKTKEQCIEAAIDDGDLNAYKHSSGNYLIVQ